MQAFFNPKIYPDTLILTEPRKRTLADWLWLILFSAMYPVLISFSLLFTGILWIFSGLSRVTAWIIRQFPSKT
jgi:hypothetical protein